MIKHALGALCATFTLAAAAHAQDDIYYGGVHSVPSEDGQARVMEIITSYYLPIQDALSENVIQFFSTGDTEGWVFFGPFDNPEDALAATNWQDNAAWRAALVEQVGDEAEADAIVEEHLALINVQDRFAARLHTTDGADMAGDADLGAHYIARVTGFKDDKEDLASALIAGFIAPANVATGLEVIEFLGVDTEWDNLVFLGPIESMEETNAVISGAREGALIAAIADIASGNDEAIAVLEEFAALRESDRVVAVTRGAPAQ